MNSTLAATMFPWPELPGCNIATNTMLILLPKVMNGLWLVRQSGIGSWGSSICNSGNIPRQEKFNGSCEDLKGYIFDCSGFNQADLFRKTIEQVINYVG